MTATTLTDLVLRDVACRHCGKPMSECDGRSHYAQGVRHKLLCPLCGGKLHNNDSKLSMDFICAWRQFSRECGDTDAALSVANGVAPLTPYAVQRFADWLAAAPRVYGKDAQARVLAERGVVGITAVRTPATRQAARRATVPPEPTGAAVPPAPEPDADVPPRLPASVAVMLDALES